MSLEHFVPESKEVLKNDGTYQKKHRSQLEGAPTGQTGDNLSMKINKNGNGF